VRILKQRLLDVLFLTLTVYEDDISYLRKRGHQSPVVRILNRVVGDHHDSRGTD